MKEVAVAFGPEAKLIGILTLPENRVSEVSVVFSNVGLGHRIGPFRWYVDLARDLAKSGIPSLRFDIAGLGDSPLNNDSLSEQDRAVAQTILACDYLKETTQSSQFVLLGLCTGADRAHRSALTDERICGIVCLDGYAYTTSGFRRRRVMQRIFSAKRLRRFFETKILKKTDLVNVAQLNAAFDFNYEAPKHEDAALQLLQLAKRGLNQLHIFTREHDLWFNSENQFWEMYPMLSDFKDNLIKVKYFKNADHSFSQSSPRKEATSAILNWIVNLNKK